MSAVDQVGHVLAAYDSFSSGNPSGLIDLLAADVVWSAPGTQAAVGREHVASRLSEAAGSGVELVGVHRGDRVVVLEFARPWWRDRQGAGGVLRSLFDIRGEQAVWLEHGRIVRIDSHERPAYDN